MRKLIVTEFVSLDGVMEAPGGEPGYPHSGWVFDFMGPEQQRFKLEETLEAEALLLGRVTYEGFASAWPEREGEFAEKMNSMPKHVVTSTLEELAWSNSTPLQGELVGAVTALKEGDGGPILVAGSGSLVHALIESDLVDELRLMVFPVILGSGIRIFPESAEKKTWDLANTQAFPSGVQVHTYTLAA